MKIYISGMVTGLPKFIYKRQFARAEKQLRDQGFYVFNPVKYDDEDKIKTWADYMKRDIKALCECDAIFLLKSWKHSKGARLEVEIAQALGMEILGNV